VNDLQSMEQEKSVLRWGGLAGVLAGILTYFAIIISHFVLGWKIYSLSRAS